MAIGSASSTGTTFELGGKRRQARDWDELIVIAGA
jgi:hypothetical protein